MRKVVIDDFPDGLYERVRRSAAAHNRSVDAEIIVLLERAIPAAAADSASILLSIRNRRRFSPAEVGAPDSISLLREQRES